MKKSLLIIVLLFIIHFNTNAQVLTKIDEIAKFNEGLAGIKKGDSWGFIDTAGVQVIDFRKDVVESYEGGPKFSNGLCLVQEMKDEIIYYGYINTNGKMVIPTEYLVATNFENGYARVIKHYKTDTGTTNALGKKIVNHSYNELLINTKNETIQHLQGPHNLLFDKLKLKQNPPIIHSYFISDDFITVRTKDNTYTVYKLH